MVKIFEISQETDIPEGFEYLGNLRILCKRDSNRSGVLTLDGPGVGVNRIFVTLQ